MQNQVGMSIVDAHDSISGNSVDDFDEHLGRRGGTSRMQNDSVGNQRKFVFSVRYDPGIMIPENMNDVLFVSLLH